VKLWGGRGGSAENGFVAEGRGGGGGYVSATLSVTAGSVHVLRVGGGGNMGSI